MIYLVTLQQELFQSPNYQIISVEESLQMMQSWSVIQTDSETNGRDAHLCDFLCVQFGNDKADARIVVDTSTVDIRRYKEILEDKMCIFQNAKFDLQFFFNYGIIIRKVYDTMIVEQLLHLGYPSGQVSYALNAIADRRLHINIDKSVRSEIIWRGLDEITINYAAGDVTYLEKIMWSQVEDLKRQDLMKAARLECDFVPTIAYLEWCGIHLDKNKWKDKMEEDKKKLEKDRIALNTFVENAVSSNSQANKAEFEEDFLISTDGYGGRKDYPIPEGARMVPNSKWSVGSSDTTTYNYVKIIRKFPFCTINLQGDLFTGFDANPHCIINWNSSSQVVKFAKFLGFDTKVKDKKTGEDKDSVLEKLLKQQQGINDEFLQLYFDYQEHFKVCTSFGQGHLDAINPVTGRIHTIYKQLGAASGRMSCGSQQPNTDLAKARKIPPKECTYPNMQQLPHDEITRACFTAQEGNLWVSCDYSAQEGRVQGDIYQDEAILKMYKEGIDGHSMYAKIFFKDELKDIDVHDVKKLRPDLRTKAKSPEFALAYGGGYTTIMQQLKCSEEEAKTIVRNYEEGFKGTAEFAKKGSAFVRKNGYILMCPLTGHKMYWWDHEQWLKRQQSFTQQFWEEYRTKHKGTGDNVELEVSMHFRAASKWDRLARNAPPQGTSACMTKTAATNIFNWIVDNGYFGKILLCALVHDETNWEFPKEVEEFPNIVETMMEQAAAKYCKSLPIPAVAEVGPYWKH